MLLIPLYTFLYNVSEQLVTSDPKLAFQCFFGPATPYQYRLMGPGAWKGARDAIMTQWERTYAPLKTRECETMKTEELILVYKVLAIILIVLAYHILM